MDDMAHIDLYVNTNYRLTFAYPVNVPQAMAILTERLEKTRGETDQVAEALGMLVHETLDEMPEDISTMTTADQDQMVFLLCGFLKHLCDEADDTLEAGNQYHLRLQIAEDDSMVAEIYDVETVH